MINHLEKNKRFAIIFTVLIAVEIFVISSMPGTGLAGGILDPSLVYHFIVFFLFNFFLTVSLIGKKKLEIKYVIYAAIFSIAYAILDELHQLFVPSRVPSLIDILVDTAGIFLSVVVYIYHKNNSAIKKKR